MLVQVRLLHCSLKSLTYSVPVDLEKQIEPGIFVQVPLQNRVVAAVVSDIVDNNNSYNFKIKSIQSIYPFPKDSKYLEFVRSVSRYYQVDSLHFFKRVQQFLQEKGKDVDVFELQDTQERKFVSFSEQQQKVYDQMSIYVQQQKYQTMLLHGVTGSGKTEIYKKLIADVIAQNKTAFMLLPEVTLALQFEKIFAQAFSDTLVIGFHSAASVKQKRLLWKHLLEKKKMIVVGVHLPILLPVANLGLIIVDEEHDAGYQEKKHPKIQSRDMAILRAALYKVPIVLGSATPSMQSLWNVQKRGWKLFELQERFAGKFPKIEIVSLKNKQKRKQFWITGVLQKEIQQRLQKKEQVIIFLNRRGYSFFVQCPCSFVFSCQQCSVSLTLHNNDYLICHYCGHSESIPHCCPDCNIHHEEFLKKGIGTQQVVQILQKLFPQAVIARADADTTVKKRSWQQTVQDMLHGEIDILVGTQSITKGYHFPKVTLVGVLWADLNLHFPKYNAVETTLQQLIQVAGRSGRQSEESKVVIQAFDDHLIYNFVDELKYKDFYEQEIVKRAEVGYPPCMHIAEIEIRHKDQDVVEHDAYYIVQEIQGILAKNNVQIQVLGPVQAVVYKVKAVFAQKIILKALSRKEMIDLFAEIKKGCIESSVFFTIDPVS